jgi:sortase A
MKRNIFGTTLIVLGVLSLLGAAGLLGYNLIEEREAGESAQAVLQQIAPEVINRTPPKYEDLQGSLPGSLPMTEIEIPNYILNPQMDMPEKEYDGRSYVGVVAIPALNVELPVLADWSYKKLKVAPCHYFGSYYETDFVIAAHNYPTHFGRLPELQPGDLILFTDISGDVHGYEVVLLETLPGNAAKEMITSGFDLSLYTCTPGGASRVTVRCKAVGK